MDQRVRVLLGMIPEGAIEIEAQIATTAGLLNISESRLRRLFKREVGVALREYLRGEKMRRAATLSIDRTLSIKQIAVESGYSDLSNFYRDFRKVHGMTLGQMRFQRMTLSCESDPLVDNFKPS